MSSYNIVICMSCLQIVLLTIFIDRSPYLLIGKNNLDIMCDIQDTLKSVDVSYSTICPSCDKQNSQYQADVCYQCLTGFQMSKPNMVVDEFCTGRSLGYIFIFSCLVVTLLNAMPYIRKGHIVIILRNIQSRSMLSGIKRDTHNLLNFWNVKHNLT
jgi:hypothetical protein